MLGRQAGAEHSQQKATTKGQVIGSMYTHNTNATLTQAIQKRQDRPLQPGRECPIVDELENDIRQHLDLVPAVLRQDREGSGLRVGAPRSLGEVTGGAEHPIRAQQEQEQEAKAIAISRIIIINT